MSRRDEIHGIEDFTIELANDRQAISFCTPSEYGYLHPQDAHTLALRLKHAIKALSQRPEPPAPGPVYLQNFDGEFAETITDVEHLKRNPGSSMVLIGKTELNVIDLIKLHNFILKTFDYHQMDIGELIDKVRKGDNDDNNPTSRKPTTPSNAFAGSTDPDDYTHVALGPIANPECRIIDRDKRTISEAERNRSILNANDLGKSSTPSKQRSE